jgi:flagellar biosynthetic protein FliR
VPLLSRLGLALFVALVLLPLQARHVPELPIDLSTYLALVAREVLVGVTLGFGTLLVFASLQIAGQLIGMQLGLNIATVLDPLNAGQQVSYMDQFYSVLAALVFLAIDGHHGLLLALQHSFEILPPGTFGPNGRTLEALISLVTDISRVALRLALPVLATLLLVDLVMALMSRIVPQMNVFFVAIPLKLGLGLWIAALSLPMVLSASGQVLGDLPLTLMRLLRS